MTTFTRTAMAIPLRAVPFVLTPLKRDSSTCSGYFTKSSSSWMLGTQASGRLESSRQELPTSRYFAAASCFAPSAISRAVFPSSQLAPRAAKASHLGEELHIGLVILQQAAQDLAQAATGSHGRSSMSPWKAAWCSTPY